MGKRYLKQSWISPKLEVRESMLHGRGLFAKEAMAQGEVVVIWGGNFVQDEARAQLAKAQGKAIQRIDKNLWEIFVYETRHDDPAYGHNHSCDPNTWMNDEVTITALRDIFPSEELTIDYVTFVMDEHYKIPECRCGSDQCRHVVTGKDWRRKDLQLRYGDHFSPYLLELIRQQADASQ